MRRREFVAAIGAAAVCPLASYAQPQGPHVGAVMINTAEAPARTAAFEDALRQLGWSKGGNLRITYRLSAANRDQLRAAANDIIAANPDVVLVQSTPGTGELLRLLGGKATPVVFVHVSDPIGAGYVSSLAKPGRPVTGFIDIEASLGGKWLQLLHEVAPSLTRAALLFNPDTAPGRGDYFYGPFEAAGRSLGVTAARAAVHNVRELETTVAALGRDRTTGLAVVPESFTGSHSAEIIALAERHRVPAIYSYRLYAEKGGLLSYGIDSIDLFRRAAAYIDRILKGTGADSLPVQQPTKFELVVNLRSAKAIGVAVPPALLARADEVIE
jgi:putative tryptophan/tyrosine transport system substrate-binding protein